MQFPPQGNMDSNEIPGSYRITESGLGENLVIPEGTKLVVWNLPYLEREKITIISRK